MWIKGQFALHHVDTRTPLDGYIAAIHATLATTPVDVMKQLNKQLIVAEVQADPERARESWGMRPEHQVTTPAEQRFTQSEQR